MPEIRLERIGKKFGQKMWLDNVSLKVDEGTFVCLLGPSGGGKTTLLKIIAGLMMPTEGRVYFDDVDVTTMKPNLRDVSMVFEDFALYPHMSVFDNIASPLVARKASRSEIEKKVKEVTKFLKIDRFLDRQIKQLSGGEMQRVAIGRALAKDAKIVLFDEIFVNLDYKLREQMRVEFKELMDKVNLTTIFSSPDPEDALSLADSIAVVHEGKIVQYDHTEAIYNNPIDMFTGRYFGYPEMNIIDCSVGEDRDKMFIDAGFFVREITSEFMKNNLNPGEYSLGVRPEHITIENIPNEHVDGKGSLILTEVIGSDTIVHIESTGRNIEVFTPGMYRKEVGIEIEFGFDLNLVYIFDKNTGKLIGRGI